MSATAAVPADPARVRTALGRVRVVAIADALLLVVLLFASLTERESWVAVLGPIHGVGFLALLYLTVTGAGERLWGWWFPIVTLVTTGPPGSLIGDLRIRRSLPPA